jgi:hypothetical protein
VHYKIKVLIISRFNYYEIMLINCLLIICDTYRVNKLIEAKLGLGHLNEQSRAGKPTCICNGTWWLGILQRIMRIVRNRWGLSRQPIDSMNKLNVVIKKTIGGLVIMVLLN